MTERPAASLSRSTDHLAIGPSAMQWNGDSLVIDVNERCCPFPRGISGHIRVTPESRCSYVTALDGAGLHCWTPVAPSARIEMDLSTPKLSWRGFAYLDSNFGDAPLEQSFRRWNWSRARLADGSTVVLYDVTRSAGNDLTLALKFSRDGSVKVIELPPPATVAPTAWKISRGTRCDSGSRAAIRKTLEDGPFYARSIINTKLLGEPVCAIHESLSLDRFEKRWVQMLLPFRMPRVGS
jgi:carotenoid 1,2-hydratase